MSLRFTRGSHQKIEITSSILDMNSAYTIAGWLYLVSDPTGTPDGYYFFGISANGAYDDGDILQVTTDRKLRWTQFRGSGSITMSTTVLSVGTWYYVALSNDGVGGGSSLTIHIDAVFEASSTPEDIDARAAATKMLLGDYIGGGSFYEADMRLDDWRAWQRELTASQLADERDSPTVVDATDLYDSWSFASGPDLTGTEGHDWAGTNSPTDEADYPDYPAGGPTYTLAVDVGSYTHTGTAVDFLRTYSMAVDAGSYAHTGTAVDFSWARSMDVDPGVYVHTGTAVDFLRAYEMVAAPGSYSHTGTDVDFVWARSIVVDAGSYSHTGVDVTFTLASTTYELVVDSGVYVHTGTAITTVAPPRVVVTAGTWSVPVTFLAGDEWMITLAGPSCDAPRARIVPTFLGQ